MNLFTRLATVTAVAAMLGAALPGAGPAGAADPAATGKITFLIAGEPAEKAAYDQLVAQFSRTHRTVQVQLVCMPNGRALKQRMLSDFAAGTPADLFLLNFREYASYAARDLIEPLDGYVANSKLVRVDDFYPQSIAPYRWNGNLMGIPQNLSSLVVYYNKALFAKAKVPLPKPGWTWADFLAAAQALTKDLDRDGVTDQYGLGTEAVVPRVAPFIWANGGDLVDNPAAPTKLTLDSPATREALEWFIALNVKHGVVPSRMAESARTSESRFIDGTMAMFLNSRKGVPTYREACKFDWDVAALPVGKTAATVLHSDAFFMAKGSTNKAAAWAFMEYANSAEGQTLLARTGRTVPSRKAIAASQAFLATSSRPRSSKVFLDVIPTIRPLPVIPAWPDIESKVSAELERAYHGDQTLEYAIFAANDRTQGKFTEK